MSPSREWCALGASTLASPGGRPGGVRSALAVARGAFPAIAALALAARLRAADASSCVPRITGVIDGPLGNGAPQGVEIYFPCTVFDASDYSVGSAKDGAGSSVARDVVGLSGCIPGDSFVFVASEAVFFERWFRFEPDIVAASVPGDGDDVIELFENGSAIDTFGVLGQDGSGTLWEYLDGWAYRRGDMQPNGTFFSLASWVFSGKNALDGDSSNAQTPNPFPARSYKQAEGMSSEPCPTPPPFTCKPIIAGVMSAPAAGSQLSVVEVFFPCLTTDASEYDIAVEGVGGAPTVLSGCVDAGGSAVVALGGGASAFESWFGFAPDVAGSGVALTGVEVVKLLHKGVVVDVFGNPTASGTSAGAPWVYTSGWAYRKHSGGPTTVFNPADWQYSGVEALVGAGDQSSASRPFPVRSFVGGGAEAAGRCPAPAVPVAEPEEDDGMPIVYIVVIVVLGLAVCLAMYTVMSVVCKKLKRKLYGGPLDEIPKRRAHRASCSAPGSTYGRRSVAEEAEDKALQQAMGAVGSEQGHAVV